MVYSDHLPIHSPKDWTLTDERVSRYIKLKQSIVETSCLGPIKYHHS